MITIDKKTKKIIAGIDEFLNRAGFPAIKKKRDVHFKAGLLRTKTLKKKVNYGY